MSFPISFEFFPTKTPEGAQKLRGVRQELYARKPEVARAISGEYRVWLTDVYRRSISADYFSGIIYPRDPKTGKLGPGTELEESLDEDYVMAVLDPGIKSVEVFLKYPGNTIRLDFEFDSAKGRKSVKEWCGR